MPVVTHDAVDAHVMGRQRHCSCDDTKGGELLGMEPDSHASQASPCCAAPHVYDAADGMKRGDEELQALAGNMHVAFENPVPKWPSHHAAVTFVM